MWKMIGWTALVLLLPVLAACTGSGRDRLITPERVGMFTFDQEVPDMGKGYVSVPETIYTADQTPIAGYAVKTADSVVVARIRPGKSIDVFSPEFKTTAGIHPGMNLREAVRIAGEESLNLFLEWPNRFVTVDDRSSGLSWAVEGGQMTGGWQRFEKLSNEGKRAQWDDFQSDAVVSWITVTAPRTGNMENTN